MITATLCLFGLVALSFAHALLSREVDRLERRIELLESDLRIDHLMRDTLLSALSTGRTADIVWAARELRRDPSEPDPTQPSASA